jgi:hypothetical protein
MNTGRSVLVAVTDIVVSDLNRRRGTNTLAPVWASPSPLRGGDRGGGSQPQVAQTVKAGFLPYRVRPNRRSMSPFFSST